MASFPRSQARRIPADVRANVRARVEQGWAGGCVLGVIDAMGVDYFACGHTSVCGGARVDQCSVFEIGSVTKVFTGLLLADMVVKGEVSLGDPVQDYLPRDVRVPVSGAQPITLCHLATHHSGLPSWMPGLESRDPDEPYRCAVYEEDQLLDSLSNYTLTREPGTQYEYSNCAVRLLGAALARHDGATYQAMLHRRVLAPLGMSSTMVDLTPGVQARLAAGSDDGRPMPNCTLSGLPGSGGLRSTAEDLTRFLAAAMELAPGPLAAAFRLAREPVHQMSPDRWVGLGWALWRWASARLTWHNGGTGGYRSAIAFDPERCVGAVVLTNSTEDMTDAAVHVLDVGHALKPVRTKAELADADLDACVGRYRLTPTCVVVITRDDATLVVQAVGDIIFPGAEPDERIRIWASAPDEFFFHRVPATVSFKRDADGRAQTVTIHHGNAGRRAERIAP